MAFMSARYSEGKTHTAHAHLARREASNFLGPFGYDGGGALDLVCNKGNLAHGNTLVGSGALRKKTV